MDRGKRLFPAEYCDEPGDGCTLFWSINWTGNLHWFERPVTTLWESWRNVLFAPASTMSSIGLALPYGGGYLNVSHGASWCCLRQGHVVQCGTCILWHLHENGESEWGCVCIWNRVRHSISDYCLSSRSRYPDSASWDWPSAYRYCLMNHTRVNTISESLM
jgi:hypothetical protein